MTKVKPTNIEKPKDSQESVAEKSIPLGTVERDQHSELSERMVVTSNPINKPKKQLTVEEVKLKYDKPFFGGGVNTTTMSPSTGAIKKAKFSILAEKKIPKKKVTTLLSEKVQKPIQNDNTETLVVSELAGSNIIQEYDSLYNMENRHQDQNTLTNESANPSQSATVSPSRLLGRRELISPDHPMGDEDFQFPKKYSSWSNYIELKSKESLAIETNNRYDTLSSDSEDDMERNNETQNLVDNRPRREWKKKKHSQSSQNRVNRQETTGGKKSAPPPLVLKGSLKKLGEVKQRLREECGITKVNFKFTRFNTLIHVENEKDYLNLIEYFKHQQVDTANEILEFHTYTPSNKKTHAFVIRGLDFNPDAKEVKNAFMEEYEIEVGSVYQMHTKYRPLFMIVTSSAITLKYLQITVKYLMNVRVFIEERQNVKRIIQCHRCQEWGHATSNCFRAPRCLKCAEGHATKDCKKPKETDPKCCNCGGKHPANATICETYQRKLANLGAGGEATKVRYKPAPTPKENVWNGGKNKEHLVADPSQSHRAPRHTSNGVEPAARNGGPPLLTSAHYPELGRSSKATNNGGDTVDEIVSSVKLVEELNKKVNFKELNRALNDLNQKMRHVTTGIEAFQLYYQFVENLENNYHILN